MGQAPENDVADYADEKKINPDTKPETNENVKTDATEEQKKEVK